MHFVRVSFFSPFWYLVRVISFRYKYVNMPNQGWSRDGKKSSSGRFFLFILWFEHSFKFKFYLLSYGLRGAQHTKKFEVSKKLWDSQKEQQPWMKKKKTYLGYSFFYWFGLNGFFFSFVSLYSGSVHITIDHCILLQFFSLQLLSSFVDGNVIFA